MILLALFTASACTHRLPSAREGVVAKVNGESVSLQEFQVNFNRLKGEQDAISQKNPKLIEELKVRALNEVLILALVRHEAIKQHLKVAKEEVDGRLANWKDSYAPGDFEEMLRKQNTTEDYLKRRIEDQLFVEKMADALATTETMVSDEEMKSYFTEHPGEFSRPEKVHVFQIVVPTKEEAEKIRQEIISGKLTFESAARQFSLSPDASKGGDLGFFSKDEKIVAFNQAFSLPLNQISKPIQSRYGLHLLKVVERKPAKKLGFNEAKDDIVTAIKQFKKMKVYKEWVTKLLKDGDIYRNEALYATIN